MNYLYLLDSTPLVMPEEDTNTVNEAVSVASEAGSVQAPQSQQGMAQGGMLGTLGMVAYVVVLVAVFYFLFWRPQKKKNDELKQIQDSLKPGDDVMTSSGFYGKIAEIDGERVIVEFGSSGSKSVRVPVKKTEIYGASGVSVKKDE